MEIDQSSIQEFSDMLEMVLDDMPSKPKEATEKIIQSLKSADDVQKLIKIQDELEAVSNMNNVDSFTRNEIMNVITSLEEVINN